MHVYTLCAQSNPFSQEGYKVHMVGVGFAVQVALFVDLGKMVIFIVEILSC